MTATMSASWRRRESLCSFVGGFVLAVVLQQPTGWWLNSGVGVAVTLAGVVTAAIVVAAVGPVLGRRDQARALWVGVNAGLAASLLRVGPGTIWPIVIVIGGALTGVAVFLGAFAGGALRK